MIKVVMMGTIKLKKTSANQLTQHIIYFAHLLDDDANITLRHFSVIFLGT